MKTEEELNRALDIPSEEMIERIGQFSEKIAAIPTFELDKEDNQWKLEYCSTELERAANINDSSTDWDFIQYCGTAATIWSQI